MNDRAFRRRGLAVALSIGAFILAVPLGHAAPSRQMHAGSFCGPTPDPPAESPTSTPISASVGVPFSITLDSNRTTGYSWALATQLDPNVVELLQNTYQRSGGPRMGAGGTEIWTFEPLCA